MELWLVILLLVVVVLHWIAARALLQRTDGRMVVLVVLGSGGHTSEILSMLGALEERLKRGIVFVVAETDKMSQQRAARLFPRAEFVKTPRAREVHQSWLTTVITTFVAALHAIKIVFEQQPDLVRPQNVREFSRSGRGERCACTGPSFRGVGLGVHTLKLRAQSRCSAMDQGHACRSHTPR